MQKGPSLFCDVCEKQLVGFTHFELADRTPGRVEHRHVCSKCAVEIFDFILELKEEWKNFNTTVQDAVTALGEWVKRRELLMPTPTVEDVNLEAQRQGPGPNVLPIIGEKKQEDQDEETERTPPEESEPTQEEGSNTSPDEQTSDTGQSPSQDISEPAEQEGGGVSESRDPFSDEEDSGRPEEA